MPRNLNPFSTLTGPCKGTLIVPCTATLIDAFKGTFNPFAVWDLLGLRPGLDTVRVYLLGSSTLSKGCVQKLLKGIFKGILKGVYKGSIGVTPKVGKKITDR